MNTTEMSPETSIQTQPQPLNRPGSEQSIASGFVQSLQAKSH